MADKDLNGDVSRLSVSDGGPISWVRAISGIALWIGGGALLLLASVIVVTAFARALGFVIIGGSEIVDVAIIVVASMALIAGTAAGSHPSVHILTERVSQRKQTALKVFALLLSLIFFALLAFESTKVLIDYAKLGEYTQLLHLNLTPFRATWVLSLFIICLLLVLRIALARRNRRSELE